jgi:hypothetical protein
MRLVQASVAAALCAAVMIMGCGIQETHYGPPPDCTSNCGNTIIKGSGPSSTTTQGTGGGGTGGTGGAPVAVSQSGTVQWADDTFKANGVGLTQPAAVQANTPPGVMLTQPVASGAFQFSALTSTTWWFLVRDDGTTPIPITPTITGAKLPVNPSITLPVLHNDVLTSIAGTIPSLAGAQLTGAHVALFVTHNNAPLSGASVKPGTGSAVIAYQNGAGFDDAATATGATGLVLLLNSNLSSFTKITVTDAKAVEHDIALYATAGAVTILTADLP